MRGLAVVTLFLDVLGHSVNMAQKKEPEWQFAWFLVHLIAGIGSIAVLFYSRPKP